MRGRGIRALGTIITCDVWAFVCACVCVCVRLNVGKVHTRLMGPKLGLAVIAYGPSLHRLASERPAERPLALELERAPPHTSRFEARTN